MHSSQVWHVFLAQVWIGYSINLSFQTNFCKFSWIFNDKNYFIFNISHILGRKIMSFKTNTKMCTHSSCIDNSISFKRRNFSNKNYPNFNISHPSVFLWQFSSFGKLFLKIIFMLNLSFKRSPKINLKKKNHHVFMHCLSM